MLEEQFTPLPEEKMVELDIQSLNDIRDNYHKGFESVFEENMFPVVSAEAYSQLLPTSVKMGRLFKIKNSSQSFNKAGLLLKKFRGIAFIPLVTSVEELADEVKLCFGEDMYKRMMFNYIVAKKFKYKNVNLPGSKITLTQTDLNALTDDARRVLPALTNAPAYFIRNNKNSIIDNTKLLSMCWPKENILFRPNVLPSSQDLILQIIYQLYFGSNPGVCDMFSNFSTTMPNMSSIFSGAIISIPIKSANTQIASLYMNPTITKIPNAIRKNENDSIALGLSKFIVGMLNGDVISGSLIQRALNEKISTTDNFVFFIHNDRYGFYVDPIEFKEKGYKFDTIYRLIKASMKAILSMNGNVINSVDLDKVIDASVNDEDIETKLDKTIGDKNKLDADINNSVVASDTTTPVETSSKIKETIPLNASPAVKEEVAKVAADEKANEEAREKELLIKTQQNNLRYKLKVDSAKNAVQGARHTSNDDEMIDDILNSLKLESNEIEQDLADAEADEAPTETENEISNTREFIENINNSNNEFIKQRIIDEAKKNTLPKDRMNPKQQARLEALHEKYKSVMFDNRTMGQILKDTSAIQIDSTKSSAKIKDDSYNYSTLKDMTSSYINKTMSYDMINIVKSFSEDKSINMSIVGFEKKDVSDQFNDMELYSFELEGDDKRKHKIQFKFPKVSSDGFMYLNGNKKLLKKQWILKPITKTNADEVYLVSDYNKTHIFRQGTVLNRNTVALKKLLLCVMSDPERASTVKITRGDSSGINGNYITTIEYDDLAQSIYKIEIGTKKSNTTFYLNQKEIRDEIEARKLNYEFKSNRLPIGIDSNFSVIDVDVLNSSDSVAAKILSYIREAGAFDDFDKFIKSVTIPKRKMFTMIELQSSNVPLIVFLSALFTFSKVLEKSQTDYLLVDNTEKFPVEKDITKYSSIKFKDKTLYYNQYPIENALLLNGLANLDVDNLNYSDLDELGTYLDFVYTKFHKRSLYKGWTAFQELFLTPITKEVLRDLGQPTDFLEIFLYANSLLADNDFLPPNDGRNYRIRDYEMLNSYLYESISEAYREYKQKGKQRFAFSIPEDDIIKKLNKSLVLDNYDATNPLNELKAKSCITYKGPQGVNSDRAFKLDRRGQTRSTIGTVGISNPENSTVGIVRQLTLNPRIRSTRGYVDCPETDAEISKIEAGSLLTAEEAVLPYITRDDPKRIGFASAQTKHVIPANNFDCPIVGTGFEQTVLDKIGDDYGYKAKKNGVVTGIDEVNKFIVIKYADNTSERVEYGSRFIRNSDFFLANNLECNVKVGDTLKKGDIVTYNKDFFKKHMGRLMYTQGTLAKVAILEGEMTEEDSSCISQKLAELLSGTVIKRKQIVLGSMSNLVRSVKKGEFVKYGDPLLLYEDQKDPDADMSLLELLGSPDDSILDKLTRHKGEANYTGTVSDIKVYWTCDPDEMSESLRKFVKQYIKEKKAQIDYEEKQTGIPSASRHEIEVSTPYGNGNAINGAMMPKEGGVLIEYYIRHDMNKRGGDKITVNSSLKSVITQVIPDEVVPKRVVDTDFKDIDVVFSLISVDNRMVTSIWHTGWLQKIVFEYSKRLAKEYIEKRKKK